MIRLINPYTPGAGLMPTYLAGREKLIKEAKESILSLKSGYPQRPTAYYGLRGVGKTVLLNTIEEFALENNIIYEHIEIIEKRDFLLQLTNICRKFINRLNKIEQAKSLIDKALSVLENFKLTYTIGDSSISAEVNRKNIELLSDDLTELFVIMGNAAKKSGDCIIFFIDEIQYSKEEELSSILNALHRTGQLRLPITFFVAGLNKILKQFSEIKTYSERMFDFKEITSLNYEETRKAIIEPVKDLSVDYGEEAVKKIYVLTGGYPYFIQFFCDNLWKNIDKVNTITINDVNSTINSYFKRLDEGFFKSRFDRCTDKEKEFIQAMVKCGELPCTINNVAKILKKSVGSISPIRAQLINKGIIYSVKYGEIDFTVPQFDLFLKRVIKDII